MARVWAILREPKAVTRQAADSRRGHRLDPRTAIRNLQILFGEDQGEVDGSPTTQEGLSPHAFHGRAHARPHSRHSRCSFARNGLSPTQREKWAPQAPSRSPEDGAPTDAIAICARKTLFASPGVLIGPESLFVPSRSWCSDLPSGHVGLPAAVRLNIQPARVAWPRLFGFAPPCFKAIRTDSKPFRNTARSRQLPLPSPSLRRAEPGSTFLI